MSKLKQLKNIPENSQQLSGIDGYHNIALSLAMFLGTEDAAMLMEEIIGKNRNIGSKINYVLVASAARQFGVKASEIIFQGKKHKIGAIRDVLFYVLHSECKLTFGEISELYYTPRTNVFRKYKNYKGIKELRKKRIRNPYANFLELEKNLRNVAKLLKEFFSYE